AEAILLLPGQAPRYLAPSIAGVPDQSIRANQIHPLKHQASGRTGENSRNGMISKSHTPIDDSRRRSAARASDAPGKSLLPVYSKAAAHRLAVHQPPTVPK